MLGSHILKTYSAIQPTISLSSGEAEFYGVVRASGAGLGQASLFRDLGVVLGMRVWTDSSASIGICSRQGLGKLRHIDTHTLWIQEKVRTKVIQLRKVRGDCNPPDLLTKHIPTQEKLEQLVKLFGCEFRGGRAKSAPLLRRKNVEIAFDPDAEQDLDLDVVEGIDENGSIVVQEAGAHDINIWPHLHSSELIEKLFPLVHAAPDPFEEEVDSVGEHERLHRRWAARTPVKKLEINHVRIIQG